MGIILFMKITYLISQMLKKIAEKLFIVFHSCLKKIEIYIYIFSHFFSNSSDSLVYEIVYSIKSIYQIFPLKSSDRISFLISESVIGLGMNTL